MKKRESQQKKKRNMKSIVLCLAGMLFLLGWTGCGGREGSGTGAESSAEETETGAEKTEAGDGGAGSAVRRGTELSLDSAGGLEIERKLAGKDVPMGEGDTWTIFVYMCGSDLESDAGAATSDLLEMNCSRTGENCRFVVQTGGAEEWSDLGVSEKQIQRHVFQDGKRKLVYSGAQANMGAEETLREFLLWGLEQYPAEHMGLVFWDHGGGSIDGVCYDELYGDDTLLLEEIDRALSAAADIMTDRFVFIGFDACLMATAETANIAASYADYMYASEDVTPEYGWDYKAVGEYLASCPESGGEELGQIICDDYYERCVELGEEETAVISCVDLSEVDRLLKAFHQTARFIYENFEKEEIRGAVSMGMEEAAAFGWDSRWDGYSNMIDMGDAMRRIESAVPQAGEVRRCLDRCVVYQRKGSGMEQTTGLALYYPRQIQGSGEAEILKNICIDPYYMAFLDRMVYEENADRAEEGYDDSLWLGEDACFWSEKTCDRYYWGTELEYEEWCQVEYEREPWVDDWGIYGFVISEDTISSLDTVWCSLMLDQGDSMRELGTDNNVDVDRETGKVEDCFDGTWYCLADGQPLALYVEEETEESVRYSCPVLLNGEETELLVQKDSGSGRCVIEGVREESDPESGEAPAAGQALKAGDEITPGYYVYAAREEDDGYEYGEAYPYTGDGDIQVMGLPAGDYYYGFEIYDIYGWARYTDYAAFGVEEDGSVFFYE